MVTEGEKSRGAKNKEFGVSKYKLLYMKQINNKVLLYSTGNYSQYLVIIYNGKESEKECILKYINIHIIESFCCTCETNTML